MSTAKDSNNNQPPRVIKKVTAKKTNPTEKLAPVMVQDKAVGKYVRIFLGGPDTYGVELVVHRPIGVHDLDEDDWVLSSPEEVAQLKSRSKDPNATLIKDKRTQYVHSSAVDKKLMKFNADGALTYPTTGDVRANFISGLKKSEIEKNKDKKDYKFILSLSLLNSNPTDSNVAEEIAYANFAKVALTEAEKKFPATFRTHKGALNDTPQVGVAFLKGKAITEVGSMLLKHGQAGPIEGIRPADPDDMTTTSTGSADQWFFFDSSQEDKKQEARKIGKKLKDLLGGINLIISDKKDA